MTMEKNFLLSRLKAIALKKRTYSLFWIPLMTVFAFTSMAQAAPKLEVYNSTTVFDATTAVANNTPTSVDLMVTGPAPNILLANTNVKKTLTLKNTGSETLNINSITLVQKPSTVKSQPTGLVGCTAGGTANSINPKFSQPAYSSSNIAPGASATVEVLFDLSCVADITALPDNTNLFSSLALGGDIQINSNDGGVGSSLFKFPVNGIIGTSGAALGAQADIRVFDDKGKEIQGDQTPTGNRIIDFGSISLGGQAVTKTFTVKNIGNAASGTPATTALAAVTLNPATPFSVSTNLSAATPLGTGASTIFAITLPTTTAGSYSSIARLGTTVSNATLHPAVTAANIKLITDAFVPKREPLIPLLPVDLVVGTTAIEFAVTANITPLPVMEVLEGTTVIPDEGAQPIDFGVLLKGSITGNTKTFTIRNTSTVAATKGTLTLTTPITLTGTGFTKTEPSSTSLNSGLTPPASTTFTVTVNTATSGSYEGEVSISNNDPDNNPYSFRIKAVVVEQIAQEIQVFDGKPADIQAGTAKEIFDGQADAVVFEALVGTTPLPVKTFCIRNTGGTVLKLSALSPRPTGLSLLGAFPDQDKPGEIVCFDIQLDSATERTFSGTMEIFNDDSNENPFDFPIVIKVRKPAPEIQVMDGTKEIIDGTTTPIDFGATLTGKPVPRVFTINNIGEMDLTLITPPKLPDGFSSTSTFPTLIPAKGTASFTVQLDANIDGEYKGEISFGNNDIDENPFNFAISGKVDKTIPNNQEIDVWDGNAAEVTAGTAIAIPNNSPTSVEFGQTPVGTPTFQTFTVQNAGLTQLRLFGLQLPSGFSLEGGDVSFAPIAAQSQTSFTVKLNAIKEGIYSGQLILFNDDDNETPYIFPISGIVGNPPEAFPELQVMDGEAEIANNTGPVDFGTTIVGTKVTKTVTINNVGGVDLNLTKDVVFSGTGFTVTSFTSPLTIASGASTTFKVTLDANSEGAFDGTLSFDNNDPDEAKFSFAIKGIVGDTPPPAAPEIQVICFPPSVEITDNTGILDFGQTAVGTPVIKTCDVNNIGNADLTLTSPVTFAGSGFTVSSFTSPVKITSGGKVSFQVTLDATTAGNFSGSLSFENDDNDENPFNFAISGVVVGTPPTTLGLQVSCGTTEIVDGSTTPVDFGTTKVGQPLTKTCTVKNTTANKVDLFGYTVPAGFSIGIYPDNVAASDQFTFEIQLNTSVEGPFSGPVKLFNSADTKNPFDFVISGTVVKDDSTSAAPEIQVLDGEVDIVDGTTNSIDFGVTGVGMLTTKIFTVKNKGTANLNLTSEVTFTGGSGFTVKSFAAPQTLPPEGTTTFEVTFTAATEGQFIGVVSFGNDDSDENPFDFPVSGQVDQSITKQKECFEQGSILIGKNCVLIPESTAGTNTGAPTNTKIKGGISKSEGGQFTPFQMSDTISVAMPVITAGVLKVDSSDIGKSAGIIAAGLYKSSVFPKGFEWYTLVTCSTCPTGWRVDILAYDETTTIPLLTRENLLPFDTVDKLPAYYTVNLYEGLLPYPGELDIYFGYRVDEGDKVKVVYSQTPIHATINP
jgi:Abnormal spindle-like microcephaly-assoc'd, ASPM-SPD-2-Hydin